jgi:hypothetical protein
VKNYIESDTWYRKYSMIGILVRNTTPKSSISANVQIIFVKYEEYMVYIIKHLSEAYKT